MYTLAELAEILHAEVVGNPQAVVRRARPFEAAEEGDITFAGDVSYRSRLQDTAASAVILASPAVDGVSVNLLLAANPKLAFARAVQAIHGASYTPTGVSPDLIKGDGCAFGDDLSIHPRVTLGQDCVIGNRVTLHPGVVLGDRCRIGEDTILYANVTVYADCEIGSRVIIHAGTVIGADGFGFVADKDGNQVKLLQLARVHIEDDCEVGANCTIDRGGFQDTVLRRGVKLDNFIHVGHNCEIGENTVVAALTGFSGGTRIGRDCVIGGQVGTNQHITIGDRVILTARAGVTKNVRAGSMMGGTILAMDYNKWRRAQAIYTRLPEIVDRLKKLEREVTNLYANKEE